MEVREPFKLCFVSHFPWMKVCKQIKRRAQKNEFLENENMDDPLLNVTNENKERQESISTEKECLKLRGGANAPKHLSIEHDKAESLCRRNSYKAISIELPIFGVILLE